MRKHNQFLYAGSVALWLLATVSIGTAGELRQELQQLPFKILYETYQNGNWELFQINADGSQPVNLTQTPDAHEGFPRVSPDGRKLAFSADEGAGEAKVRNIYVMNRDGTGRTLIARHARYPFWNASGTGVCYVPDESDRFTVCDYASKGLCVYDLATQRAQPHPNPALAHLYNLCCTADDKWIISTIHAGMGCSHGILAIAAHGQEVFNLHIPGCRPDVSPDGKRVAWNASDFVIRVGDLDFSGPEPKVIHQHDAVTTTKPAECYQANWSPDGRYLAFTSGTKTKKKLGDPPEFTGVEAPGWDLYVADANGTNRFIRVTTDGKSNKQPAWAPVATHKP